MAQGLSGEKVTPGQPGQHLQLREGRGSTQLRQGRGSPVPRGKAQAQKPESPSFQAEHDPQLLRQFKMDSNWGLAMLALGEGWKEWRGNGEKERVRGGDRQKVGMGGSGPGAGGLNLSKRGQSLAKASRK